MKKILLISTLIVVAVWWFWPAEEQVKQKIKANIMTFDEGLDLEAIVESSKSERRKQAVVEPEVEVAERQEGSIEKQKELSYLEVYQQLQLAKSCDKILSELMTDKNVDFDQWLIGVMRDINRDELYQPKKAQFDLLHQHIVECADLKDHVLGLSHKVSIKSAKPTDNNSSIIIDELEGQLSKTKAKTEKEQALALSLELTAEWKETLLRVAQISKGVDSLSAEEILSMVNRLKSLKKSRYKQPAINEPKMQIEISLEMDAIEAQLASQKHVDEVLRKKVMAELNEHTNILFDLLYRHGPEVFSEVNQALNLAKEQLLFTYEGHKKVKQMAVKELVPEYVFPMEITQNLIGGIDAEWLVVNGDHIDRLIYCDLGGDCSADSLLARTLCLPFYGYRVQPEACGSDVETHMHRELSPNQWQDIMYVVDWLEEQYGS